MSDPAPLFQNLKLEDMPVTRSRSHQSHQRGRGGGRGRRGPGQLNPPPAPAQGLAGPSQVQATLPYDNRQASFITASRAIVAPEPEFSVDRLRGIGTGRDKYFAFQLRPGPVSVRVPNPAGQGRVDCSCGEFRRRRAPCVHIQWLLSSLYSLLERDQAAPTIASPRNDVALGELYPFIEPREDLIFNQLNSLPTVPQERDSDDSEREDISTTTNLFARRDVLCDLLSSFDRRLLPDEFRSDFVDHAPIVDSPEDCFIADNLYATVYQMAIRDETFFRALRKVVPYEYCANQYYKKQHARAIEAMQKLSHQTQPSRPGAASSVPACARELRHIVHQIYLDRGTRTTQQPLGADVAPKLAELLVLLIQEVCRRNEDVSGGSPESGSRPRDEPRRNRNLYAYLISDPPFDPTLPAWMRDAFVIDGLRNTPATEWRHLFELLTTIKDQVIESARDDEPAALAFAGKIEEMLREYTIYADEPSSSSAQLRLTQP